MSKHLKSILVGIAFLLAVLYAGDFLLLEFRIHKGEKPFDTVQVANYSAVPEKNNRVEFFYNDAEPVECVETLFPHFGDNPCWYLNRHRDTRTDL